MGRFLPSPRWSYSLAVLLMLPTLAVATDLRMVAVTPGRSARIMIDGRAPIAIEVGQTIEGVKVVSADPEGTVVTVGGKTMTLPLEAPPSLDVPPPIVEAPTAQESTTVMSTAPVASARARTATLFADSQGHFFTPGTIDDEPVDFLVDTGATLVALSRAQADRMKLDYRGGTRTVMGSANGAVRGWLVTLRSVRIGGITIRRVDGVVLDSRMPMALLGMSFLNHFDMNREGSKLVLKRRGR